MRDVALKSLAALSEPFGFPVLGNDDTLEAPTLQSPRLLDSYWVRIMKSSAEDGSESAMLSRVLLEILLASGREPMGHPLIFSEPLELVLSDVASSR